MANPDQMIADLNGKLSDLSPAEERIFKLCRDVLSYANNAEQVRNRIVNELRVLSAAKITSWKAVNTSEDVAKLIVLGYSRENAVLMVEEEEKRKEEERKKKARQGSNFQRGGRYQFNFRPSSSAQANKPKGVPGK